MKVSESPGKSDYATSLHVPMHPGEDLRTWHLLNAAGIKSQNFISIHLTDIIWKLFFFYLQDLFWVYF